MASTTTPPATSSAMPTVRPPTVQSLDLKGWRFSSTKGPIVSQEEDELISTAAGVSTLPEICFGRNELVVQRLLADGSAVAWTLAFRTVDALRTCSLRGIAATTDTASSAAPTTGEEEEEQQEQEQQQEEEESKERQARALLAAAAANGASVAWMTLRNVGARIQVPAAKVWANKKHDQDIPDLQDLEFDYDWTYLAPFAGRLDVGELSAEDAPRFVSDEDGSAVINIELLQRRDPIRFYDDVLLFEDELHDHGDSRFSVKIRVMDTCFLVLARSFLRVDKVKVLMHDVRVFHEFGRDDVVRETSVRESSQWNPLYFQQDENMLSRTLPLIGKHVEVCRI